MMALPVLVAVLVAVAVWVPVALVPWFWLAATVVTVLVPVSRRL